MHQMVCGLDVGSGFGICVETSSELRLHMLPELCQANLIVTCYTLDQGRL